MTPRHFLFGLALLLTASAWAQWVDRRHANNVEFSPLAHHWVQPVSLSERFPNPITPDEWSFNYELFEERLFALKPDPIWSATSLTTLDELVQLLPETLSQQERNRLNFLMLKSLPGERGMELADLLPRYERYRAALDPLMKQPQAGAALAAARDRFMRTREYRQQYLGARWHQRLFAEQEATAMVLLNRLQARYDQSRNTDTTSLH